MYYMIIILKFMEPEAEVKLVQNFYYKIYISVYLRGGQRGSSTCACQLSTTLRLRLRRYCNRYHGLCPGPHPQGGKCKQTVCKHLKVVDE